MPNALKKFACLPVLASALASALAGPPSIPPARTIEKRLGAAPKDMLALINRTRAQSHLSPLKWDDKLAKAAAQHARIMAQQQSLSHQFQGEATPDRRMAKQRAHVLDTGENVVRDRGLSEAHASLMSSPPHRANILDPDYDAVGIGVAQSGDKLYIAEDFAQRGPRKPGSRSK